MVIGLISLPEELLLEITTRLDRFALLALSQVCRRLLYLSLSSSLYWHSDYVPAFLPVIAPIDQVTAVQFRQAAIRSWRTRCILMDPSSSSVSDLNPNPHSARKRITKTKEPKRRGAQLYQTIGSRFFFKIDQRQILFWDAYTGRKVLPISELSQPVGSSPSSNMSPFTNSPRFGSRRDANTVWCDTASSICVSTDQIRVAICWNTNQRGQYEGFLERATVTFKTLKSIKQFNPPQTNPVHNHDDSGTDDNYGHDARKGNEDDVEEKAEDEDNQIYAEFQWEIASPVFIVDRVGWEFRTRLCRMSERYVVVFLSFSADENKYVRLYDWDNPLRPSYIYHEYNRRMTVELICTPCHIVFITAPYAEERMNGEHYLYIRPIPLFHWFPDSSKGSNSNFTANLSEEGWMKEVGNERTVRCPGALAPMNIQDKFTKEYDENKLPVHHSYHHQFYAIGNTDVSRFDSSTFCLFMESPLDILKPDHTMEYYVVLIPPLEPPKVEMKALGYPGNPEDAANRTEDYIRVVDHGYHTSNISVLSTSREKGPDDAVCKEEEKEMGHLDAYNGPYTFIYHLQENKQIENRNRFLISKSRSINWYEEDRGFDAYAGIAVVEGKENKEIIWYS